MAVAYGTKGGAASGSTSLVLTYPSSIAAGDFLFAVLSQRTRSITWTLPSGWSLLSGTPYSAFGPSITLTVAYKVADGTESGTATFTPSGSSNCVGEIFRYTGSPVVDVGGATTFENTTTAATASGVTTTVANAVLICVYATDGNRTYTPAGSMTERDDFGGASSAGTMVCDETIATAGATGTRDATVSSSSSVAMVTFALKPSGQTAAVNTATETDTANAIGRTKTRAVGTASDTETAPTVGRKKTRTLAAAGETDAAVALGRAKQRAVSTAGETNTVATVGRAKQRAVGTTVEVDQALAIGAGDTLPISAATETDTAIGLGRLKTRIANVATEISTAGVLGRLKARLVGTATEVDTAGSIVAMGPPLEVAYPTSVTLAGDGRTTGRPADSRTTATATSTTTKAEVTRA